MITSQPPNVAGARTATERSRIYLEVGKVRLDTLNTKNMRLLASTQWGAADEKWRVYCQYLQNNYLELAGMLSSAAGALEQAIRTEQDQAQTIANLIGLLTLARTAPKEGTE